MKLPRRTFTLTGAAVAFLASLSAGAVPPAVSAGETRQLKFERTITAIAGGLDWRFRIEGRADLTDGKLIGRGSIDSTVTHSSVEEQAHQQFSFEGTYGSVAEEPAALEVKFRYAAKLIFTVTKAPPLGPHETCLGTFCVGQTRELFSFTGEDTFSQVSAKITAGVFEERTQVTPGDTPVDIFTRLEIIGGKSEGDIALLPEHPIIPGHASIPNAIEVVVPDTPALKKTPPFSVRISLGAGGYGGLAESRAAAIAGKGTRELEIKDAKAGSHHTIYYGWHGALLPDFPETVRAEIPGKDIKGSATFDVGFGVDVTGFGPFTTKTPKTREVQPFRITVARSGGKQPSIAELAKKFDLELQLDIKRTNFQPATSVEQLISDLSFNTGDWVEALAQQGASLDAVATGKSPGSLYGDKLLWRVAPDGRLWDSKETSIEQRHPNYLPFQRGVHMFTAQVSNIVHGTEKLANPTPKALGYTLNVEMKDTTQAFFDQIALGCAGQIVQAVADEIKELKEINPAALAGVEVDAAALLWSCIKIGLDTELADEFLSQHILLNTLVMTVLQTEADVQELLAKVDEVMKPTLKGMPGQRVLLLESSQKPTSVETSEHVALTPAGNPRDEVAAAQAAKRDGGAKEELDRTRIQSKGTLTALYARENEGVSIRLPPSAGKARLFVVTGAGTREIKPTKEAKTGDMIFQSSSSSAANGGTAQVAPAQGSASGKDRPVIGGACTYGSHPGTCTITQVAKTAASAAQAKVEGGAGYEGREVKFAFTSAAPIASPEGQQAMREQHELRLKNAWYPGPRFLEKYAITPGKSFACALRVRTSGACTPVLFDFPAIDTGDTSEAR